MFTITIKKEGNGNKTFAKIFKTIIQLPQFVGKTMVVDW